MKIFFMFIVLALMLGCGSVDRESIEPVGEYSVMKLHRERMQNASRYDATLLGEWIVSENRK